MGVIKGYTKTIEDGEHRVTIRMLSFLELQEARDARISKIATLARSFADVSAALRGHGEDARRKAEEKIADDPLEGYDIETLLRHGVVSWDYDNEDVDVRILDERSAKSIAREVLACSNPEERDLGKA